MTNTQIPAMLEKAPAAALLIFNSETSTYNAEVTRRSGEKFNVNLIRKTEAEAKNELEMLMGYVMVEFKKIADAAGLEFDDRLPRIATQLIRAN